MTRKPSGAKAAKASRRTTPKTGAATKTKPKWASLTWDDLTLWAGSRSVSRGRSYQRQGRVEALAATREGGLLATVVGGQRYVVLVSYDQQSKGRKRTLQSTCTCPVGVDCKHGVAAVVEALDVMADGRDVAPADAADPRLNALAKCQDGAFSHWSIPGENKAHGDWDQRIRDYLQGHDADELVELIWSLTQRYPELYSEFREQIQLAEGDVANLVAETMRQIAEVTSEPAWSNHWNDEGHSPDYAPIQHRLERLSELGHDDEVASLGRELITLGFEQIAQSHDDGLAAMELAGCLEIVFKAVVRSSLSGPEQLLYGIDACLQDDYDIIDESVDVIFKAKRTPEDWSEVADELAARLDSEQRQLDTTDGPDTFSRNYGRNRLTGWLLRTLDHAQRGDELREVYEREARLTGSYERLVRYLIDEKCYDDAEAWAREGIEKTHERWPGIAVHLGRMMGDLARQRKQWKTATAYSAWQFFDSPGVETFGQLLSTAGKARCKANVREQAIRFLETGHCPIQPAATKRGTAEPLLVEPDWPLPVPDTMHWLLRTGYDRQGGPHYDVLVDLAIAEKRPEDVLRWYDQLGEKPGRPSRFGMYAPSSLADCVAEAVAGSHPNRALEIYEQAIQSLLPSANLSAYEQIGTYLRRMRPVFKALGRGDDWQKLVDHLREEYRRRPRFIDVLDALDGRTILQTRAKSKPPGKKSTR